MSDERWREWWVYLDVNGDVGPIIMPSSMRIRDAGEAIFHALSVARRYWPDENIKYKSVRFGREK